MLFPYGQILLVLSRVASSEWLSVGKPNTSSRGLLMVLVVFFHFIEAVNWVPVGQVIVRFRPPVGVFSPCSVLCFLLIDRQRVGGGLSGSGSIDRIGPGIRSRLWWT